MKREYTACYYSGRDRQVVAFVKIDGRLSLDNKINQGHFKGSRLRNASLRTRYEGFRLFMNLRHKGRIINTEQLTAYIKLVGSEPIKKKRRKS